MADIGEVLGPLAQAESALCAEYHEKRAKALRDALRADYEIAVRLHEHKAKAGGALRKSLVRCGLLIGKDRATLLRIAAVALRMQRGEFESLVALEDWRGYPVTFRDLMDIVAQKLSREGRRAEVLRRLELRSAKERPSSVRLRPAPAIEGGPGIARTDPSNGPHEGRRGA